MARLFSLPWVLTVPFVFNLVGVLGCLTYVNHWHQTQLNAGVAQLLLQQQSQYLRLKLEPSLQQPTINLPETEQLFKEIATATSIAVYDWEGSGRNLATATLAPGEEPYLPGQPPNLDPIVIQDSARIILEQLTLNPALENQNFDGSFRSHRDTHFFQFIAIARPNQKPWTGVIVLSAHQIKALNRSVDYVPALILIIFTGLGIVVLTGWRLSCWLNSHLTQLGLVIDGITTPAHGMGPDVHTKDHNPRLQEFTALGHKVQSLAQTVTKMRKDLLHVRDRHHGDVIAAKQEAEIANRAKSAFIANMSHELRTPLNSIMVSAQILEMDHDLSMEAQEYVTIIYQSGQDLLQLINNLIDLSRLDNQRVKVNLKTVELEPLLTQLKTLFNPKAKRKGLMLNFYLSDRVPPQFQSDPLRLKEILTNLIRNAIQYTDRGAVIVNVDIADANPVHQGKSGSSDGFPPSPDHGQLMVQVIDTGIGLTPENLEIIFEPFRKFEITHQTDDGLGLSLTLSQKFAQLLGGSITVESRLHQGSTFTLQIPILFMADPQDKPQESLEQNVTTPSASPVPSLLTMAELKLLPLPWLQQFHQTTIEGDTEAMVLLLHQLPPQCNAIAKKINTLIENYQLEILLELFSQF